MTADDRSAVARQRAERTLRRLPPARRLRWLRAHRVLDGHAGQRSLLVADAGCEDGMFDLDVAARHPDWSLVGVDLSADAVRRGESDRRAAGLGNVAFAVADITRPYARDCDVVLMLESLVEVPDDAAAVRAAAAALRPGGIVVGQVPAHDWGPALRIGETTWRREVRHGYTGDDVRRLLADAGFTDVSVRPTSHALLQAAQDVRDRYKNAPTKVRLALFPAMWLAARLEFAGLRWGTPRAWFFTATRS